jgi:hypothetical protein
MFFLLEVKEDHDQDSQSGGYQKVNHQSEFHWEKDDYKH